MKVKDIMTTAVRTVGPDTSLKEVAVLLSHHRISGLPVVAATGAVVGVVSKTDILRKESAAAGSRNGIGLLPGGDDPALALKVAARTAGEAMTAPAVTISPESSVAAAATLMLELGIERLPVSSTAASSGWSAAPTSCGPSPAPTPRSPWRSTAR